MRFSPVIPMQPPADYRKGVEMLLAAPDCQVGQAEINGGEAAIAFSDDLGYGILWQPDFAVRTKYRAADGGFDTESILGIGWEADHPFSAQGLASERITLKAGPMPLERESNER